MNVETIVIEDGKTETYPTLIFAKRNGLVGDDKVTLFTGINRIDAANLAGARVITGVRLAPEHERDALEVLDLSELPAHLQGERLSRDDRARYVVWRAPRKP